MALADRVVEFVVKITGDTRDLSRDLGKVENDAKQATGRIQSSLGKAGSFMAQNWQAGAAAAGAAISAFAAQAIGDFRSAAKEAQQTAASTGMSVEEASKYLATLRKMGVDASGGDLADVVNNINQNADAVRALGIEANDSAGRVSGLIDYIGGISDETERARLASKFFGEEGARQFGVLIDSGGRYKEIMDSLSDGEFINAEESRKAAEFEATLKQLEARVKDVSQALAEDLVEGANDAERLGLIGLGKTLFGVGVEFTKVITGVDFATRVLDYFGVGAEKAAGKFNLFEHVGDVLDGTGEEIDRASQETEQLAMAAEKADRAWSEFLREQERIPGLYDRVGRAIDEHVRRMDMLVAKARELTAAAREANAAQAALANFGSLLGVQDSLNAFEQARQNWMTQNHEAVFAGDLNLDPTVESAQAADALAAARDAAIAAVRASMALGKTPQQQAQRGAGTLQTILDQNPWLRDSLGPLLQQLQAAAGAGGGGPVPAAFTGGISGLKSQLSGGSVIVVAGGSDPRANLSAAQEYAYRNGGPI